MELGEHVALYGIDGGVQQKVVDPHIRRPEYSSTQIVIELLQEPGGSGSRWTN
jgi:hypothetical protein